MSSRLNVNPCQAALRSKRCPVISDSESDDEHEAVVVQDFYNDIEVSQELKPVENSEEVNCVFVQRLAPQGTRVESIEKLEINVDQLQFQIEEFKLEKERIRNEIRDKKRLLIDAILKVVEYEKSIQAVEAIMGDKLHHFQTRIINLESKRMDIFLNSGDSKVFELIEQEINEVKEEFEQHSKVDEAERDQLTQQAQTFAASLGDVIKELQNHSEQMILEAEIEKSPDELAELKTKLTDDIAQLTNLINRPAQFCKDKAGKRFYLNLNKEKVFKIDNHSSEHKLSADGVLEKVKEGFKLENNKHGQFYVDLNGRNIYTEYYFEDEYGRFYIDIHGHRHYKTDPEASEYMLFNGNWKKMKDGTYKTDERGLRIKPNPQVESGDQIIEVASEELSKKLQDDDLNYIKESVGPAIRKALAAVVLHQPEDPINYFANFLLNYRYNQHMFKERDEELQYFLELREHLKESDCGEDDCQ